MAQLNKVFLIGNLTRDVEVRNTQSGTVVGKFGMAVNETYVSNGEKKQKTTFVDVTAFGKNAENLAKFFSKGSPIFVEGKLDFSQWETDAGEKRSKLAVICNQWQFMEGKKEGAGAPTKEAHTDDYGNIPF